MSAGGSHLSKNSDKKSSSAERRSTRSAEPAARRAAEPTVRRSAEPVRVDAPVIRKSGTVRKKKRRKGGVPSWLILVLLIAGMLFAGFMLTKTIISYRKNRASYDALRDIAVVQLTPGPRTVLKETDEGVVEEVVQSEVPISVDWDTLRATNPDIIGWLYCPDTVINYPVVRATDNDKYLTTNFEGSYNAGGSLFADYGSSVGFRSSHLIIYGHNMKDNSMFGTLKSYGDAKYYEKHPVFYFLTPDQAYRVDLLEAATIDATLDNYPTYFGEGETLESYVGRISRNVYWFNDQADYQNNQLMTMSTCTSSDAQRLIVQGVMVPIE